MRVERFPKFNTLLAANICQGIKNGYTRKMVANRLGVHENTLRKWLKAGRQPGAHPLMEKFVHDLR